MYERPLESIRVKNGVICRDDHYFKMYRSTAQDPDITGFDKGLLGQVFSLPNKWKFRTRNIAMRMGCGTTMVYTALKSLEANGYLIRTRTRDGDSRFVSVDYEFFPKKLKDYPNLHKDHPLYFENSVAKRKKKAAKKALDSKTDSQPTDNKIRRKSTRPIKDVDKSNDLYDIEPDAEFNDYHELYDVEIDAKQVETGEIEQKHTHSTDTCEQCEYLKHTPSTDTCEATTNKQEHEKYESTQIEPTDKCEPIIDTKNGAQFVKKQDALTDTCEPLSPPPVFAHNEYEPFTDFPRVVFQTLDITYSRDNRIIPPIIPPLEETKNASSDADCLETEKMNIEASEKPKSSKKPKTSYPDEITSVGDEMIRLMIEGHPGYKKPAQMGKLYESIDLMVRVDKRDPNEIISLCKATLEDEFWKSKLYKANPAAYLRTKFDQLTVHFNTKKSKSSYYNNSKPKTIALASCNDYITANKEAVKEDYIKNNEVTNDLQTQSEPQKLTEQELRRRAKLEKMRELNQQFEKLHERVSKDKYE